MKQLFFAILIFSGSLELSNAQTIADQDAIKKILVSMEQGWNEKNGKLFASGFNTVHDYIVWNGIYFQDMTVEGNAAAHQNLFDGIYKNNRLRLITDKIEFIRDDLAMVYALGAGYDTGTPEPENPEVLISMLMEKKDGEWKIIAFHNSDIEISFVPGEQKGTPVPPQVMFKSWYEKS